MIKYINEENFKSEVLDSKKAILVDFFATWCGPCKILSKILEDVSKTSPDLEIAKVDIDELRNLAIEYEIEFVPTMLIFKDGKVIDRIDGVADKNEILAKMEEYK